jgi:hypothetical protein
MEVRLNIDEIGALAELLPASDGPHAGLFYDGEILAVSGDDEALITTILQDPSWREKAVAWRGRAKLVAHTAKVRFAKETGGIDYHGYKIDTSRDGCAALAATVIMAQQIAEHHWKTKDGGFLSLEHRELIDLARTVCAHVQRCFALEMEAIGGIVVGSITSKAQIETMFGAVE